MERKRWTGRASLKRRRVSRSLDKKEPAMQGLCGIRGEQGALARGRVRSVWHGRGAGNLGTEKVRAVGLAVQAGTVTLQALQAAASLPLSPGDPSPLANPGLHAEEPPIKSKSQFLALQNGSSFSNH